MLSVSFGTAVELRRKHHEFRQSGRGFQTVRFGQSDSDKFAIERVPPTVYQFASCNAGLRVFATRIERIKPENWHFINYGVTTAFGVHEFACHPTGLMTIHKANDFDGKVVHGG